MSILPCPWVEQHVFICNWEEVFTLRLITDTYFDIFHLNKLIFWKSIVITLIITTFASSINQFLILIGLSAKV